MVFVKKLAIFWGAMLCVLILMLLPKFLIDYAVDGVWLARRTAHMKGNKYSKGSKPCVPGCTCGRHKRWWENRK